jgi:hypothetical protein
MHAEEVIPKKIIHLPILAYCCVLASYSRAFDRWGTTRMLRMSCLVQPGGLFEAYA